MERDPSAKRPLAATRVMTNIIVVNTQDPITEFVESEKIWMIGTPVFDSAVLLMSPMQKQTAMRKIKPVTAPR